MNYQSAVAPYFENDEVVLFAFHYVVAKLGTRGGQRLDQV